MSDIKEDTRKNYLKIDPYNVIRLIMSFLSRWTQESELSDKKEEKRRH